MDDPSSIYEGYLRSTRYSAISNADLAKAYKPYQITLKSVRGRKLSDTALRSMATRAVLKRYLAQKKKKL